MILLELHSIKKDYTKANKAINVLQDVSLSINKGEVLSLLGVNGAGKTTLSNIIAGLTPPSKGDVLYNNVSIYNDIASYRLHVGFCPQQSNLDPHMSVYDNLYFAAFAYRIPKNTIDQRIKEVAHLLNIHQYLQHRPVTLSGGYKQRVMIARSILHRPALLILDEPTVALDPAARQKVWDLIRILAQQNITILLTTHYLEEAEILSDRVCIVHKGVVHSIDTPERLKAHFAKNNLEDVFLTLTSESIV